MNDNIPWTEKYRPTYFNDIVSHDLIKNIFNNLINKNTYHHIILYGPPGIGKTTIISNYLKKIYNENYKLYILELNGSDDRGINIVRDEIKNYSCTNNIYNINKKKFVILDEVDSMTHDAQNALKEIIELYEYNTHFCLICNFINKIIYPLQSCCIMFRLPSINQNNMKKFLLKIIEKEKIKYTNDGINSIIKLSNGDLRKSCNNLQSIHLSFENISKSNVHDCLGIPTLSEIKFLFKKNIKLSKYIDYILKLRINNGYSLSEIITNTTDYLIDNYIDSENLYEILINLANIEYNISNLGLERIQIYSFASIIYKFIND